GQHTASFDCRLFSERYPEYCFVYVSQAVTGAVADVRMDCLPTLPLSEGGAGGWGEWSAWSACPAPAHCSTRTRSRHRFCDSPPPAYGAKFCEVSSTVEVLALT
ncbi:jg14046, partial [Pararge aegeria aegeria]